MRTITTTQARVYASNRPAYAVRVWTWDANGLDVNLGDFIGLDWVVSVEWGEDVDSPGMDATITVGRARQRASLAPGRTAGIANVGGTLLAPGRPLWVEAAIYPTTRALTAADWIEVFRGVVQDVDWGDPSAITISAVGQQFLLQSTWIESVSVYGSGGGTPVEDVIQSVLDDWIGAGAITLVTPVSPSWMILPFQSQIQSVWDEITLLSDSLGWNLRYLYNDGATEWQLTLYEPDRAMVGTPYVLSPSRWIAIQKADDSLDNVRNVVSITYGDSNNLDATGQPTPATESAEDAASIGQYGRRAMLITLDATSQIDTASEATTMSAAILADVAWPKTVWEIAIPYFHAVELGDILTLSADGIWLDTDTDVSVVGYRHSLGQELRTTLQLRSAGAVSHHAGWLERAAQRGVAPLAQVSAPPEPTDFPPEIRDVNGAVHVQGNTYWSNRKGGYQVEAHAGPVGFTPDLAAGSATIIGRAKNAALTLPSDTTRLPVGEARDVVVYYLNDRGVRSGEYRLTRTARRPGLGWVDQYARLAGSFAPSTFSVATRGSDFPPDGWTMAAGTWGTDAVQDDGGTLVGPLTGKYALTLLGSGATEVYSQTTPVAYGRRYVSQVALYADATSVVTVVVEWLLSDETTVYATDTLYNAALPSTSTWYTFKRAHGTPTGCRYARVRITKAASSFKVAVDRVLFEEDAERDDQSSRVMVAEDFIGPDGGATLGSYPWTFYRGSTGSSDEGPGSITKLSASNWERCGIVSLETADPNTYPSVSYALALGTYASPTFSGLPPAGTEMEWVVAMGTSTTDVRAWCGLWQVADGPVGADGQLVGDGYNCGIGFIAIAGTWYGIVRLISGGVSVNRETSLGVSADTTWRRLGWYYNGSIVIFIVDGQLAGTPQSTTDFGDVGLSPIFGLVASGTDTPSIQVDRVFLHTLTVRT